MTKIKRIFLGIGLLIATTLINPLTAIPMAAAPVEVQAAEAPTVEPRADNIYYVYRTLDDGTVQKRRWNATRGYWVDPYWITVN